jgi:hypothetical protein
MKAALVSCIIAVFALLQYGMPASASTSAFVAVNRCNTQVVDESYAHIRDFDRRAPGTGTDDLMRRFAAIAEVLTTLHEEREIVDSVCPTDAARTPLFTEIAASTAWALALEADIAGALNASCPAAQKALPTMMLADAWLTMANVINENNGTVPSLFNDTIGKVRTRAAAVGLSLPVWSETSRYWSDNVAAAAKKEAATCPAPSPSPG